LKVSIEAEHQQSEVASVLEDNIDIRHQLICIMQENYACLLAKKMAMRIVTWTIRMTDMCNWTIK
jgi:hypothetical protein